MVKCQYCGEVRETEFYNNNKSTCKVCVNQRARLWAKEHPDKVKQIDKKKREKHKEKRAKYYREWYAKNGRSRTENYSQLIIIWQRNHPTECKVQKIIAEAIRKGELLRPLFCALCGKKGRINAHHDDYNQPFDILWVCSSCHKKLHLGLDKAGEVENT